MQMNEAPKQWRVMISQMGKSYEAMKRAEREKALADAEQRQSPVVKTVQIPVSKVIPKTEKRGQTVPEKVERLHVVVCNQYTEHGCVTHIEYR